MKKGLRIVFFAALLILLMSTITCDNRGNKAKAKTPAQAKAEIKARREKRANRERTDVYELVRYSVELLEAENTSNYLKENRAKFEGAKCPSSSAAKHKESLLAVADKGDLPAGPLRVDFAKTLSAVLVDHQINGIRCAEDGHDDLVERIRGILKINSIVATLSFHSKKQKKVLTAHEQLFTEYMFVLDRISATGNGRTLIGSVILTLQDMRHFDATQTKSEKDFFENALSALRDGIKDPRLDKNILLAMVAMAELVQDWDLFPERLDGAGYKYEAETIKTMKKPEFVALLRVAAGL